MKKKGFTLIELLIVVAIIAILAAIAVPNFLEAQTRSKVSRVKADMRSIATGIEAYATVYNAYPTMLSAVASIDLIVMTTPIQFMTSIPHDPFTFATGRSDPDTAYYRWTFFYNAYGGGRDPLDWLIEATVAPIPSGKAWMLLSFGPDQTLNYPFHSNPAIRGELYDPTNGTVSSGDVVRTDGNGWREDMAGLPWPR